MIKFLRRIWRGLESLYYALPIQLVVFQFKYHKAILGLWVLYFAIIGQVFGSSMGVPFMYLAPEYLGEVSFLSLFLLGAGTGAFIASYHISTYISDSYRIQFLGLLQKPFYTYFLNNSLIPILFIGFYCWKFIAFQIDIQGGFSGSILWELAGFLIGFILVQTVLILYFLGTNRNLAKQFGKNIFEDLKAGRVILGKAKTGMTMRYRMDWFLGANFRWRKVDKTVRADFRTLVDILNQNHGNALFLELLFLAILVGLGLLEDRPYFQFPAAASFLIFFSLVLMLSSALTFWFRKIGFLAFVLLIGMLWLGHHFQVLKNRHPAYGMNYAVAPAAYTSENLDIVQNDDANQMDRIKSLEILDRWKLNYQLEHGRRKKPKAVFVTTSGGGSRASYLTFRSLQIIDSLVDGKLMDHTRLITGASGGMVGATYYRELHYRNVQGDSLSLGDPAYSKNLTRDILNPVIFKFVTGMLLPTQKIKIGDEKYKRDRGYAFDSQLMVNLPELNDRRLSDYADAEEQGRIPMLILTPIIINDGRRLYVSSTPVTYMTRNIQFEGAYDMGHNGVEFSRFFDAQESDSLLMATALRMNASFPMVTPYIALPSRPHIRLIDAGAGDNYGIQPMVKYLFTFREWFAENTSEILVIQIRDSKKNEQEVETTDETNMLDPLFDPIGGTYESVSRSKEVMNDDYLSFTEGWYDGKITYTSLEYHPTDSDTMEIKASLSWRLTEKEIESIDNTLTQPQNQRAFQEIEAFFQE